MSGPTPHGSRPCSPGGSVDAFGAEWSDILAGDLRRLSELRDTATNLARDSRGDLATYLAAVAASFDAAVAAASSALSELTGQPFCDPGPNRGLDSKPGSTG